MQRTLYLLEQAGDAVHRQTGVEPAQVADPDTERRCRGRRALRREPTPEGFVDGHLEGTPGTTRLSPKLGRDVVIEGQGRTHIMMLLGKHHDVKQARDAATGSQTTPPAR